MPTIRTRAAGATGAVAAMLAIATPFLTTHEGLRTKPYRDSVGVLTVCIGETRVDMRTYTPAECKAMLDRTLASDFGPKVLACTPPLAAYPTTWAAHVSLAYNIGTSAYCRSTAARLTNARRFADGCNAFMLWNRPAAIIGRRRDERDLCLKGLNA